MSATLKRVLCLAVTAVAAGGVLAGCSEPEPVAVAVPTPSTADPSPTPSETAPDPEQLKADNIAGAEQRVADYWAAVDEVGQTEDDDTWKIEEYLTSNLWLSLRPQFEDNHDAGVRTDGAVQVESITVTEYLPSESGLERITLDACLDFSGRTAYDGDGEVIESAFPDRYVTEYVLAHDGSGTLWRIDASTAQVEEAC